MHRLVSLNAIDIIDFDGEDEEGLELASREDHEVIAKQLTTYRSVLNWVSRKAEVKNRSLRSENGFPLHLAML